MSLNDAMRNNEEHTKSLRSATKNSKTGKNREYKNKAPSGSNPVLICHTLHGESITA